MLERLLELERDWFFAVNGSSNHWLDCFMFAFSGVLIWCPLVLVLVYFIIRRRRCWLPMLICTLMTGVLNGLITLLLFKPLFMRYRPTNHPLFMEDVRILNDFVANGDYGFISGHSTNAFAYAMLSALVIKNKWYSVFIFLWAAIMAYSRVYLGAHFISDVIPGALMGVLLGWLLSLLYRFILNRTE